MISRSSSSTYRLHFSGSTPATNHLLSSFFHSFEICKNCNIRESQPALHTHRTHTHNSISGLQLCGSRRRKLPGECSIKAKRRRRPARSRIPLTPVQSLPEHTPHHNTPHGSPQTLAPVWGALGPSMRVCVCVCVFNVWLSGLVKNSCGEAEDLWLNHSGGERTEEKVGWDKCIYAYTLDKQKKKKPIYDQIIFRYLINFLFLFLFPEGILKALWVRKWPSWQNSAKLGPYQKKLA